LQFEISIKFIFFSSEHVDLVTLVTFSCWACANIYGLCMFWSRLSNLQGVLPRLMGFWCARSRQQGTSRENFGKFKVIIIKVLFSNGHVHLTCDL